MNHIKGSGPSSFPSQELQCNIRLHLAKTNTTREPQHLSLEWSLWFVPTSLAYNITSLPSASACSGSNKEWGSGSLSHTLGKKEKVSPGNSQCAGLLTSSYHPRAHETGSSLPGMNSSPWYPHTSAVGTVGGTSTSRECKSTCCKRRRPMLSCWVKRKKKGYCGDTDLHLSK